ncbi:hypothetical protein LU631_21545 [Erwinia tracheiphila]|uniref:Uncharacterized protein n=2 Tax=Erwinia tracheiphila TaxID=65700 RepID=A0A0M2KFI9_9GAMM|nr:hypothetical protein [Erwinia tracheiphila]EOS94814.1 hypothetical protein ETR_11793 [Erwinia tracheiphila PSU-1]KKF35978.1 hypothetical protein SY86_11945 [Erwinia tracheiphila]UIA87295.1 hypothetical protein LU631_21545 [Erwinia tracheiphila]UIA95658.1 hypothetical protein LU633_19990 [Erwinia tracheiphila]
MTNLPHDYYVTLLKILLKKSPCADKFRLVEVLEREAMRIAASCPAISQAKSSLVTRIVMRGAK